MKFSVLLSVYKDERPEYLHQALTSIWDEQLLKPDQVVLVQDGPLNEALYSVIILWKDWLGSIFTVIDLPVNVGLGKALNQGIEHCSYDLIARMDSDDVSYPDRFSTQVQFMVDNPDIAAASSFIEEWSADLSSLTSLKRLPCTYGALLVYAKKRCPLNHPVTIYRKSIIKACGGYPPLPKSQDYPLWATLLVRGYKLANIPLVLLKMRTGDEFWKKRALKHLKFEIMNFNYQRRIRFINNFEYIRNISIRILLRLSPAFCKKIAYKFFR